jgi:hypothetical protein
MVMLMMLRCMVIQQTRLCVLDWRRVGLPLLTAAAAATTSSPRAAAIAAVGRRVRRVRLFDSDTPIHCDSIAPLPRACRLT